MKTTSYFSLLITLTLSAMLLSCEKEKFDKNAYNELVDYQFLIDNVDKEHEWRLTHSDTVTITNTGEEIYAVQVLTKNPYAGSGAEIAAEGICYLNEQKDGYTTTLAYTLPLKQQRAFIAAKKSDGSYLGVAPFDFGTDAIDLDRVVMQTAGTPQTATPQTFTYLYEEGFPLPEDFDYNDLVLRVTKAKGPFSYQVDLTVTVEAIGIAQSYAAAILLAGVNYDDVDQVEIVEGSTMDQGYPLMHLLIDSEKTLLKSRSGEPVINLFESGHYALNHELNSIGSVQTLLYNTETTPAVDISAKAEPVTRTFRISFKSWEAARLLSFEQIDPFIVHEYNSGLWEIHTYRYKFEETLHSIYNGKASFYDNHISWALVVPKSDFRWSVEGVPLGTFNANTGETFGPYTSFADWIKDQTLNNDWYERVAYPQYLYY